MPNTAILWWSLLWRLTAALLVVSFVLEWSGLSALFRDEVFIKWKPSVLWLLYAAAFWVTATVSPLKLMRALWGARLGLAAAHWRVIGRGAAGVFMGLAVLNVVVAYGASTDTWVDFKLFAPFPILVVAIWVIAAVVRRSDAAA